MTWNRSTKACPFTGLALHFDLSPVRQYELPGNGQSQPAARYLATRTRAVAAPEAVEDERQVFGRDTTAVVADCNTHALFQRFR